MTIIDITTRNRTECVAITAQVQSAVAESAVERGIAVVCSADTTGGITVNENADPHVMANVLATLGRLIPRHGPYDHGEGNSDAHIKASLVGLSATLPVESGGLVLGTWQGIYFCEFDGPRKRHVTVQVIPSQ